MYNKIIVSLSLNHGIGERAIELARTLKVDDGKIIAVHVFEPIHGAVSLHVPQEQVDKARENSAADMTKRLGKSKDVEAVTLTGHAGRAITDYAGEVGADCIIVGSHKPGLKDFFLGSTAARIMRFAPCSVHVLR